MPDSAETEKPSGDHWTLDKRVPIAMIGTYILSTAGFIWWIATFTATTDQRLTAVERAQVTTSNQGDRLTRVEVKLETAIDGIGEIKGMLRGEARSGNGLTGPR